MRRLMWFGDGGCESGFARATHHTVRALMREWEVHLVALNYFGDPHPFRKELERAGGQMYPAYQPGGDLFGTRRVVNLGYQIQPDVVVIQNDPWNIPAYVASFKQLQEAANVKPVLIGALAVDGKNLRADEYINGLDHAIFWTEFAKQEALKGGYTKTSDVVPLGVERRVYYPGDRLEARKRIGWDAMIWKSDDGTEKPIPEDAFVFLNVNRNQPRKHLDLTFEYFAELVLNRGVDAYLFMHICPTGDTGWDLRQLARYYDVRGRVILMEPGVQHGSSETELADTYRACDALITTTQGEGMGLTTLEAMACGLPCVVPAWSALGDWAVGGTIQVPCDRTTITPNGRCNVVGGLPQKRDFVNVMEQLVRVKPTRDAWAKNALAVAAEPRFDWRVVGSSFSDSVMRAYNRTMLGL